MKIVFRENCLEAIHSPVDGVLILLFGAIALLSIALRLRYIFGLTASLHFVEQIR